MFCFTVKIDHFAYCNEFGKLTIDAVLCQRLKLLVLILLVAMIIKLYGSLIWMFLNNNIAKR